MDVINSPGILDKLDDKTAIPLAQRALRELDELLHKRDQGSNKNPKGTQSDARRRLERQRNVLLWQLRRRESRALTAGEPSSSVANRPRHEPAKAGPSKGQQEKGQRLGEPSSNSAGSRARKAAVEAWSGPGQQAKGQRLGEPSSSSAVSGRRQQPSGSARTVPGAQAPPPYTGPLLSCNVCMENHPPGDTVAFACNHHCCRECLNEIYKGATADETRYPPRCCQPIPIEQSRRLLESHVLRNFLDKQMEWETKEKDRIYCSNKTCSRFIRPENVRGRDAKCQRCGMRTCADCKQAAHSSRRPCGAVEGHGTRMALRVMEENKWRRCPGCSNGIERTEGCNHMVCKCGREFCYKCGAQWRTCGCPTFPGNTVQPVQPRGLNNPANGANVGFNHVWPPRPANDAGAGLNPIQSPGLGNHSLGGDLAQRLEARRIELALERLSMKSPDRNTPSPDYTKIKQKSREMMDAWRDMKDKLRQQGYQISDSSDSDTDSDRDFDRDSDRDSDKDSDRDSYRDSDTDSDKDSSS